MATPPSYRGPAPELRKGMAWASLVLGILSIPTFGLLGLGAIAGVVLGILALVKAKKEPAEYGGGGLAIAGIVTSAVSLLVIPVIGIIAAIAIPSLLRARVAANEASATGDTRTVISAQAAYQSANGGFYDTLDCLGTPARCIPNYPGTGPAFLDTALASLSVKSGYTRSFHPGPAATPRQRQGASASPSSLQSFAYVAVPATRGQTGVRGFCGDSSGRICFTLDGSPPPVVEGQCDPSCQLLR